MVRILRFALFTVAASGLALMVGALFLQVVARELRLAVDWTEELSRFAFITMVFIAAAYSTLTRSHLRVSVFSDLVARRIGQRPVQMFHTVILIGFSAVMVYFSGYNFFDGLRFANTSPALGFNQNILFSGMSLGFLIIGLLHVHDLVTLSRGRTLDE